MDEDFKGWNKHFDKLCYKHETYQIFSDFLNLTVDNFTLPNTTPLFNHTNRYDEEEIREFDHLFCEWIKETQRQLEHQEWYDFLGSWWESDKDMTDKFKAQFFTPPNVTDLMSRMINMDTDYDTVELMTDPCCGSGRFALAHHAVRSKDWFYLADLDSYACRMTLLNMVIHGLCGVVAHMNTLTNEVFDVWLVYPELMYPFPVIKRYYYDLDGALDRLPRAEKKKLEYKPETTEEESISKKTITSNNLDKWLKV